MQYCQRKQRQLYLCGKRRYAFAGGCGHQQKRIEAGLEKLEIKGDELDGILVTHEHSDHIQGLGVFSRKYGVPIYATPGTIEGIKSSSSLGKLPDGILHPITVDEKFTLGDITVDPFAISHDANEPSGYRMECGGKLRRWRRIWGSITIIS